MIVLDNKEKLRKEMSALQSELHRILYLLRIADPTGEAVRKRESKEHRPKIVLTKKPASSAVNTTLPEKNQKIDPLLQKSKNSEPEGSLVKSMQENASVEAKSELDVKREEPESVNNESTATVFTVAKPQWLGAVEESEKQEVPQVLADMQETDQFVDYKDRGSILNKTDSSVGGQGIEDAGPGLIIRKRKQVGQPTVSNAEDSEKSTGSELKAEDAVALLLKHSKGHHTVDEEDRHIGEDVIL